MKYSMYLDWFVHQPELKYDFRSSGIAHFKYDLMLGEVDLNVNYAYGNPAASELLGRRYHVQSQNVFISCEGTSGQNTRIIRRIAEVTEGKNEAIVEYPTYEPLLRKTQEYFPRVKRLERKDKEAYRLDVHALSKKVTDKTALLVLTNPHALSGAISSMRELKEIMTIASEYGFYVLCDEIYAEFERETVPTIFSVNKDFGVVTTSFTKAYGLGGLKFGATLAKKELVDGLYTDVLNTIGNSPNIVQLIAVELLEKDRELLRKHRQEWTSLKKLTEEWLEAKNLEYFPNKIGITYWVKLSIEDTYKWVNEHTIPKYSLAVVPGGFFLFKEGYKLAKSNKIRLGLGNITPDKSQLAEALKVLGQSLDTY